MNVTDPILFLSVIVKEFIITKSSVMEIQNLVLNPKSEPVKSNSKQYQFLFKYVYLQQKSRANVFKLTKNPGLWSFLRKRNFS